LNYFQPEIILYWGYPAQNVRVTTADGYILTMHRIPWGINGVGKIAEILKNIFAFVEFRNPKVFVSGPGASHRPAVFIQHGLEASSSSWVSNLPNKALGRLSNR
jgi:hypothetical protein